ncbi:O-antigen ligase family protein [Microterricola viridarii]|uniref:O-antigen ligase n=1 Tax=Microterricola viridarii TaxID=412690 RepID=A0A1H1QZT8_9MICO|nr:O-antigen ligase family protein [Microterricola viridarii]SDS28932.1 O-antigen ligase [Microterricola viridarii]
MMQPVRSRFAVHTLATLLLFSALAGQFWRNLLGWWGWGALVLLLVAASVVALVRLKPDWLGGGSFWRRTPSSLWLFLGFAVLSLAWSFYPGATAVGLAAQLAATVPALLLGLCLSWAEFLRALGAALRWLLGLSLLFEFIVAAWVGGPVLPFFTDYEGKIPAAFYWSRGLLFDGGPIEGIVANRNLLAAAALLAVIVFAAQLAARTVRRGPGIAWLVIAALTLALTRSATVLVALVVVAAALGFALWARRAGPDGRRPVYLSAAGAVVVVGALCAAFWGQLLAVFGKSDDLTGRFDIWDSVSALAAQRPVAGWGWVSYWAPWVEPFDDLAVRKGVTYLQAHSAWLDVWLQLGVIGVVLFAALVFGTLWRSWFLAVDRPRDGAALERPYTASALVPYLLMVALLVQSVTESRILVEGGWMLLVALALITKRNLRRVETMP